VFEKLKISKNPNLMYNCNVLLVSCNPSEPLNQRHLRPPQEETGARHAALASGTSPPRGRHYNRHLRPPQVETETGAWHAALASGHKENVGRVGPPRRPRPQVSAGAQQLWSPPPRVAVGAKTAETNQEEQHRCRAGKEEEDSVRAVCFGRSNLSCVRVK